MKSLLPLAEAARSEGLTAADLEPLVEVIQKVPGLLDAFNSPTLTLDEKRSLLEPLDLPPKVCNLALLLAAAGREARLDEFCHLLTSREVARQGGRAGQLLTARPYPPEWVERLEKAVARKIGRPFVVLTPRRDPELKGGFRITVDGLTFDRTVAGNLRDLSSRLKEV